MNDQHWIQRLPKTELTWVFAWVLVFATAVRYFLTGDAVDGVWLGFLGGLVGAAVVQHVGGRATTKPEVIVAEAQAKVIEKTGEHYAGPDLTIEPPTHEPPEAREPVREVEIP